MTHLILPQKKQQEGIYYVEVRMGQYVRERRLFCLDKKMCKKSTGGV